MAVLADAGWLGLEVPEALDGAGATFAEVAVILEEMGRAAAPHGPYLGAAVLGVGALNLVEPNAGRDELLAGSPRATVRVAVALPTGDLRHRSGRAFRLDGVARCTGGPPSCPTPTAATSSCCPARDPPGGPGASVDVAADAAGWRHRPAAARRRRVGLGCVGAEVGVAERRVVLRRRSPGQRCARCSTGPPSP